ncbi:tetratricopeptide repeat protein, partial [Candidatus Venteria ishoeyi]|uniref:tetratricopeptide repeat protein n=1 Tax=Candidatus Venteria ishoeyi TaxID=1899563 RepID=UPI0025A66374
MSKRTFKKHQARKAHAKNLLDEGKTAEAIRAYQELLTQNPPHADQLYYQLGKALFTDEQWQAAAEAYQQALNKNPKMAVAAIGFGDAAVKLKVYPEAEKAYIHALETDASLTPQIAYSLKHFADSLSADKQYEMAYKAYENALGLNADIQEVVIQAFQALYTLLKQENKTDLAQKIRNRVEEVQPGILDAENHIAEVEDEYAEDEARAEKLLEEGQTAEAIHIYQELLEKNPPHAAELYCQLGEALLSDEQWKQATDAYLQALNINPKMAVASIGFGDAATELKAYQEAEKAYNHALEVDASLGPQVAYSLKHLADNLLKDRQYEVAYNTYEKALDLSTDIQGEVIQAFQVFYPVLQQEFHTDLAQKLKDKAEKIQPGALDIKEPEPQVNKVVEDIVASEEIDENELLLLQLHQTQEELESLFLKNNTLEEELKQVRTERDEQAAQLKQVRTERDEQAAQLKQVRTERDEQAAQLKQVRTERDEQAA